MVDFLSAISVLQYGTRAAQTTIIITEIQYKKNGFVSECLKLLFFFFILKKIPVAFR